MIQKRFFWCAAALFGASLLPQTIFATFTETVNAGFLYGSPNTGPGATNPPAVMPVGGLLLLVAAGTGNTQTFTAAPPAGQFVAGGDTILGAAAFNMDVGTGGTGGNGRATQSLFTNLPSVTSTASPVYIELRWYPSITYSQYMAGTATPAAGTYFGAYNPLVTNASGNTTLNPDGDDQWIQQTGGSHTVDFLTTDLGFSQNVTEGFANFMVPIAVPEPSAGVLGGLALVIAAGAARYRQRIKTV